MASKVSRGAAVKAPTVGASAPLRAETERLIAKERYKDAVKQAKLAFKEEATAENRRLLERAYFLRARQLLQLGMHSSAVEVAQHLLDFGVTASDAREALIRLLIGLGTATRARRVTVRWPSGRVSVAEHLAADVTYRVVEPRATAEEAAGHAFEVVGRGEKPAAPKAFPALR
jgi:hypothetical protein